MHIGRFVNIGHWELLGAPDMTTLGCCDNIVVVVRVINLQVNPNCHVELYLL